MPTAPKTWPVSILKTDGTKTETQLDLTDFNLLEATIGCECIEYVRVREGRLVIDGEGLIKDLPRNPLASPMYPVPTGIRGIAIFMTEDVFQQVEREFEARQGAT